MSTWWEERTARVHQATDIISTQANCSSRDALLLLRRRAAEHGSDLEDIALAVVGRRMSFAEKNSRVSV
jgi:AmiR/NasT family two-component response regulator